jgi:hypothetical protein
MVLLLTSQSQVVLVQTASMSLLPTLEMTFQSLWVLEMTV